MQSGRILIDATARLNAIAGPNHQFFRKARWEQAPDASELDGLCIFPEEKPRQKQTASKATTNTFKTPPAATGKSIGLPLANNIGKPVAKGGEVVTSTQAVEIQQLVAHGFDIAPQIDIDFFVFAAVAFGLGAWNQPDLVNEICARIRHDVQSMLERLLPKPSNDIMCMALAYTNKLFGERHSVSVLATGWGQSLVALRIIRLGLTLAYKWHEDYPNSFECGLCPWEICDCAGLNGWDTCGDVTNFPKDKNKTITEIWKRTKLHPRLPRYALARMEMEALIALEFNLHACVSGVGWISFLGRLRALSNTDAGAERVSQEACRRTRVAIFGLVEAGLRDRFKRAKAA